MTEKKRLKAKVREHKLFLNDVEQKLEIEAYKTLRASVTGLSTFNEYNFNGDTPTRGCQI